MSINESLFCNYIQIKEFKKKYRLKLHYKKFDTPHVYLNSDLLQ